MGAPRKHRLLSPDEQRAIRQRYFDPERRVSQRQLAAEFDTSQREIWNVINYRGAYWKG